MSLYKTFKAGKCLVGIWRIEETTEELFSIFPNREMYKKDVLALKYPARQAERLAVRALLYALLGEQKEIFYHHSGRPYLSDNSLHISVSHTKGYAAVIVGEEEMIGVDIERYNERVHGVSQKYMRKDEVPAMYGQVITWSLLLHWSAKETLLKSMDYKEADFKEHFRIYPFEVCKKGELRVQEFITGYQREYQIGYFLHSDFVMTWNSSQKIGE